jgi:hypothetical protein
MYVHLDKLSKRSLIFANVEVAADVFDHLTGLKSFSVTSNRKAFL